MFRKLQKNINRGGMIKGNYVALKHLSLININMKVLSIEGTSYTTQEYNFPNSIYLCNYLCFYLFVATFSFNGVNYLQKKALL